ncbi:hypothetical protein Acr_12g0010050 [Actinidia rufa]|uniref:DUF4408 domain-containing protein n=1 Tax=Actinidia rufa TaxID=165716 RepID=A0A7J0FIE5_9ERIC|nr:hypothetical protein Acr_12g0010050 [Actinidia rufa]
MYGAGTMWASMASWFTPIILFCFLNFMIATIFFTSRLKSHNHKPTHDQHDPPQLARSLSILDRVKFFDFSLYRSDQTDPSQYEHNPPQLVRAQSILKRVRSIAFSVNRSDQPDPPQNTPQLVRTPAMLDWVIPRLRIITCRGACRRLRRRGRLWCEDEEVGERETKGGGGRRRAVDQRRPSTTRESRTASSGDDEGVDGKADDFINKFKKQLKLQRLDSILRYKEMLHRGSCE